MLFAGDPLTFSAARRFMERKVNLPTGLSSAEIALKVPARIRAQSFFSAKVASAHILEGLRKEVDLVAGGQIGYAQARERLKEFLSKQGVGIPAPGAKEDGKVGELASTRRLDLILRQNTAMAHAVGQREVAEHPAVMELLPNYEYVAEMDDSTRMDHAKLNGLVLPKNDPFWKTHFPPWDFGCRCGAFDTDAPANGKSGKWADGDQIGTVVHDGQTVNLLPNESGFTFTSDPADVFADPDFASINDPDLRALVRDSWEAKAAALGLEEYRKHKDAKIADEAERKKREAAEPGIAGAEAFGATLSRTGESIGGSTGAFVATDASGQKWVLKTYRGNPVQVQNEWIANRLYAKAGVAVPEMRLARFGGELAIASKMIDGLEDLGAGRADAAARVPAVKRGFVADAWLANWDVAGLGFDNILVRPGSREYLRVDQGGALMFRAQGTPKGDAFGREVPEIRTLRDGTNPQAARVFAGVTDEDVAKQIGILRRKVKLKDVDELVRQAGMTGEPAATLASTLKARLKWLANWKPAAADPAAPALAAAPAGDLTPEMVKTIAAARLNGFEIPTDADAIEDHNVRFWHETNRAGGAVTKAILKLRGQAAKKVTATIGTKGLKPEWTDGGLSDKVVTAIKGIASRAAKGEPIDPKDIGRAVEVDIALKSARTALAAAVQAGHYAPSALADFDAHYNPWVDEIRRATAAKASLKATWNPPTKGNFAGFAEPPRISKNKAGGLEWKAGKEVRGKQISKGIARETDDVIYRGATYYDTEVDGVRVRYWPDDEKVPFALRNTMEIAAGGQDLEAVKRTYAALGKLGVPQDRSSALDREELYLHQIAYHRRDGYDAFKAAAAGAGDQAERVRKMRTQLSVMIGTDITKLPGYNPDGRYQAFGHGSKYTFRPDLQGKEWDEFRKGYRVHHKITNGDMESTIEQVLNSGGQMAPTTDKLRRGIRMGGMSPEADLGTGGASYFFTRIKKAAGAAKAGLVWDAKVVARLDAISYMDDKFGKVDDGEAGVQSRRRTGISEWRGCAPYSANETIFKNGLSLFDDLVSINCSSAAEKARVLATFRSHGYDRWPDGRSLDEVVKVAR